MLTLTVMSFTDPKTHNTHYLFSCKFSLSISVCVCCSENFCGPVANWGYMLGKPTKSAETGWVWVLTIISSYQHNSYLLLLPGEGQDNLLVTISPCYLLAIFLIFKFTLQHKAEEAGSDFPFSKEATIPLWRLIGKCFFILFHYNVYLFHRKIEYQNVV